MWKMHLICFFYVALLDTVAGAFGVNGGFHPSSIFVHCPLPPARVSRRGQRLQLRDQNASNEINSRHLLSLLSTDDIGKKRGEHRIKDDIVSLESSFLSPDDSADRFDPLIGLYEVKSVLTRNKKDNPVGGKWTRKNGLAQKLFQTRATFQHLLPFNATGLSRVTSMKDGLEASSSEKTVAEAVNVVSLGAFDGLLRLTVILRGDALPLSSGERDRLNANRTITCLTNLAVRVYFDPPRIYLGKRKKGGTYSYLPLQFGPTSSVVLDTTYYDGMVRLGMGGTSGTRFVFVVTQEEEAREYEALLKQPAYANKRKVLVRLGGIMAASFYVMFGKVGASKLGTHESKAVSFIASVKVTAATLGIIKRAGAWAMPRIRIMAGIAALVSAITMLIVAFSTGGIERDAMSRSA